MYDSVHNLIEIVISKSLQNRSYLKKILLTIPKGTAGWREKRSIPKILNRVGTGEAENLVSE